MQHVLQLATKYVKKGAAATWDELESWWLCAETEVGAAQLRNAIVDLYVHNRARAEHVRALISANEPRLQYKSRIKF